MWTQPKVAHKLVLTHRSATRFGNDIRLGWQYMNRRPFLVCDAPATAQYRQLTRQTLPIPPPLWIIHFADKPARGYSPRRRGARRPTALPLARLACGPGERGAGRSRKIISESSGPSPRDLYRYAAT